jgi:hypothetical protein
LFRLHVPSFSYAVEQNLVTTDEQIAKYLLQLQEHNWDCERLWPKIDVLLPVFLAERISSGENQVKSITEYFEHHYHRNTEWYDVFLRSMVTFWPF